MSRFENREELAGKIDWEGGLWSALEYGISAEDMPEGDSDLMEAWAELERHWKAASKAANVIYEMLDY